MHVCDGNPILTHPRSCNIGFALCCRRIQHACCPARLGGVLAVTRLAFIILSRIGKNSARGREALGKEVGEVVARPHVWHNDLPTLNALANIQMPTFDMLHGQWRCASTHFSPTQRLATIHLAPLL